MEAQGKPSFGKIGTLSKDKKNRIQKFNFCGTTRSSCCIQYQ